MWEIFGHLSFIIGYFLISRQYAGWLGCSLPSVMTILYFIYLFYCDILSVLLCIKFTVLQVIAAVIRNKKLRSVTNFFVCNLAATDILFAAGIPFIAVTRITQNWIFGESICKCVTYIQFVSGVCSILTMAVISVERFVCVCLINRYKIQLKGFAFILTSVWCISASFPIPVALSQTVRTIHTANDTFIFCGVEWPGGFHADVYLGSMVTLFFFIPLTVISGFYLRIWFAVKSSDARAQGENCRSENYLKKQVRLVKMFSSIVLLFVIMWLPFFVLSFLGVQYKQITSTHFTVTLILALANTCQNPLIYGYFNHRLREEFKKMFCFRYQKAVKSASPYAVHRTELGSMGKDSSTA